MEMQITCVFFSAAHQVLLQQMDCIKDDSTHSLLLKLVLFSFLRVAKVEIDAKYTPNLNLNNDSNWLLMEQRVMRIGCMDSNSLAPVRLVVFAGDSVITDKEVYDGRNGNYKVEPFEEAVGISLFPNIEMLGYLKSHHKNKRH